MRNFSDGNEQKNFRERFSGGNEREKFSGLFSKRKMEKKKIF